MKGNDSAVKQKKHTDKSHNIKTEKDKLKAQSGLLNCFC